ncbi:hypothetical protein AB205_0141680 [Aquarana catesbeiana]|uniref:Uncharacterized protein n=1 Tax=Aquarana catesbeiana TaxID=8400 RepID=A0A2G9R9D9_AQUCT|nr:hypothetical protein AB205_0141680 [Aquarana catesbeiana]
MDTPIMLCFTKILKIYIDAAGPDEKLSGAELKKIIDENFGELIKKNITPETIKKLLAQAKPYIENGCTRQEYAALICAAFISFEEDWEKLQKY